MSVLTDLVPFPGGFSGTGGRLFSNAFRRAVAMRRLVLEGVVFGSFSSGSPNIGIGEMEEPLGLFNPSGSFVSLKPSVRRFVLRGCLSSVLNKDSHFQHHPLRSSQ